MTHVTGLDVFANAKRESSQHDMGFKLPKQMITSMAASVTEEESGISTVGEEKSINMKKHTNRRYREVTSKTPQPSIICVCVCVFLFMHIIKKINQYYVLHI